MNRILYLHGFASGPSSKKARFYADHIPGLEVLTLVPGRFEDLTVSSQLAVVTEAARGERVSLMGSSLGGYLAALYAARHQEVERLVLLAPAFEFNERWEERLGQEQLANWRESGKLSVFHYAENRQAALGWQFLEDARQYENYPAVRQPTLIIQGTQDTVVPPKYAEEYVRRHPHAELLLLDSDHELMNALEPTWPRVHDFLGLTTTPSPAAAT